MIFETNDNLQDANQSGEEGENLLEEDEKVPQVIEEPHGGDGKCTTFRRKTVNTDYYKRGKSKKNSNLNYLR